MNISIIPDKEAYLQGEVVKGEVVILTGDKELNGSSISLHLVEFVEGTGAGAGLSRLKDIDELNSKFTFSPNEDYRLKFKVQLPKNCRISRKSDPGTHNAQGWDLRALVKTSRLKTHTHEHTIQVKPAREFEAIYETCEKYLEFKPVEAGDVHLSWGMNDSSTRFMMRSSGLSDTFVHMFNFALWQRDDSGIEGRVFMELKPQFARNLRERMAALFKLGPGEKRTFELTQSKIFLSNGEVNHTEIAKAINGIIEEVVASRS